MGHFLDLVLKLLEETMHAFCILMIQPASPELHKAPPVCKRLEPAGLLLQQRSHLYLQSPQVGAYIIYEKGSQRLS